MEMLEKDRRISRLIARKIVCKLSEAEEQELSDWLTKSERNRELYNRLLSAENMRLYQNKRNSINSTEYWDKVERIIHPRKMTSIKYIGYIAAAVLFGLIYLWQLQRPDTVDLSAGIVKDQAITPGTVKATLVLSDGKQVDLDHVKDDSLEVDGMKIYSDKVIVSEKEITKTEEIEWNKLLVPRGGEYNLVLSDGTKVYINSDSRLEFPAKFIGKTREVRLYGEAYFQVTSLAEHPFIVKTENMDVRVTGTEFNIKAYKEDHLIQTTLIQGKVSVAMGKERQEIRELAPSQQAEFNTTNNNVSVRTVDVNSVIAWKNGQFIFKGNRLDDIMATLSRWYDFDLVYQNGKVRELVFAGKLNRLENIDSMLEIIASTNKVRINVEDKTITFGTK